MNLSFGKNYIVNILDDSRTIKTLKVVFVYLTRKIVNFFIILTISNNNM